MAGISAGSSFMTMTTSWKMFQSAKLVLHPEKVTSLMSPARSQPTLSRNFSPRPTTNQHVLVGHPWTTTMPAVSPPQKTTLLACPWLVSLPPTTTAMTTRWSQGPAPAQSLLLSWKKAYSSSTITSKGLRTRGSKVNIVLFIERENTCFIFVSLAIYYFLTFSIFYRCIMCKLKSQAEGRELVLEIPTDKKQSVGIIRRPQYNTYCMYSHYKVQFNEKTIWVLSIT